MISVDYGILFFYRLLSVIGAIICTFGVSVIVRCVIRRKRPPMWAFPVSGMAGAAGVMYAHWSEWRLTRDPLAVDDQLVMICMLFICTGALYIIQDMLQKRGLVVALGTVLLAIGLVIYDLS